MVQPVPICPDPDFSEAMNSAAIWLVQNRDELRAQLHRDGALLLRGWPVRGVEDFHRLMEILMDENEELMGYSGGANVREDVYKGIYTSTEAPE